MERILLIDGCPRPESRTRALAEELVNRLEGQVETVRLFAENLQPLDQAALELRDACAGAGDWDAPVFRYARQFAAADTIVLAAPYWDLLFPAQVRAYLEAVTVVGITFRYTPEGAPEGLCRAKRLVYVTTAGGFVGELDLGFAYVRALCENLYGIPEVQELRAEALDIQGMDVPAILADAATRAQLLAWELNG